MEVERVHQLMTEWKLQEAYQAIDQYLLNELTIEEQLQGKLLKVELIKKA